MEAVAIALLVMVLVLGGVTLTIFFQFLNTVRENHALNKNILDELSVMASQIDVLYKMSGIGKADSVSKETEKKDSSPEANE